MECNLEASLNEAAAWFSANRLVVDGSKSSAMLDSNCHSTCSKAQRKLNPSKG